MEYLPRQPVGVLRDHPLDAVLRHVGDGPAAGDRLPHLHRLVDGTRNQRHLGRLVAAELGGRGDGVVLAVMAERVLVERLHHDFHLLLEQLAVGVLVQQRSAHRLDLPRLVAPPHAEDHAPVGEDVGHREVLGEADGVPDRADVEGAAELEALRARRQVRPPQDEVRYYLVALALEVVLRAPERVEPEPVHVLRHVQRHLVRLDDLLVGEMPLVRRRAAQSDIVQFREADVEDGELRDHQHLPRAGCAQG